MELLRNCLKKAILLFPMALVFTLSMGANGHLMPQTAYAAQESESSMDLVFVIDNSGSMRKNDPKFITPDVVSTFVNQLPDDAKVGMILFDQEARLLTPMTLLASPAERQQAIDSLNKIDYKGQFTNTPVGIERAVYEFKTNGREGSQRGIIFITDGIVDTGDPEKDIQQTRWLKEEVTAKCKQQGIRIFGIALTEKADFSLIKELASRTSGQYFRTFVADEISDVLKQIRALMKPQPQAPQEKAELSPMPLLPVPAEEETKPEASPTEAVSPPEPEVRPEPKPAPAPEPTKQPEPAPEPERTKQPKPAPQPEPTKQPEPESVKQTEPDTKPAPLPSPQDTITVSEKSIWMITIAVVALIVVLLGALIFFFFQNTRRRQAIPASAAKVLDIPEAYIEDEGDVLGSDRSPFLLSKETIKIGRGKTNDLVIDAPAISGFHATIDFRNMSFYLEDQRSTNGTMLNERRLEANRYVRLKDGDRISFATYPFIFRTMEKSPFGDPVMLSMTALEDEEAAATIVLDLDGADSKQGLISCLQTHLMQIYSLSANHKEFVNTYFAHDVLDIIATTAHENLQKTMADNEQHCTTIVKNKSLYVTCSLPGSIDTAEQWYRQKSNGFTQFIFKWIRSKHYTTARCEQLCVVTFGQDPATWVSITIAPTHSRPDPIEIMSVDFLNDEEKSSLALDFDHHGRVL